MLSVKQGGIKYHFWVFGMTRLGIETRSSDTKDSKMVLDAAALNTQHWKVQIKGKVE